VVGVLAVIGAVTFVETRGGRSGAPAAAPTSAARPTASTLTSAPTETAEPMETTEPTESTQPTDTTNPEEAAIARLWSYRDESFGRIALDGRWVAQLSSKYPGVRDDLQQTATGDSVFQAADILAEYESFRQNPRLHDVFLLLSTDYGKRQTHAGEPLWVAFDDEGFTSSKAVHRWCARTFSQYSGQSLADRCAARPLKA
jgi:hypothetical protein